MDKTLLKKFAIESRAELVEKVKTKIDSIYIEDELTLERVGDLYVLSNNQSIVLRLSKEDYDSRELLKKRVKELSLEQVIEEASYTWFNRIVAIRYMELNDILPLTTNNESLGIRILSDKNNELDPEILKYSNINNSELDLNINKEKYDSLSNDNEKFKYILIKVSEKLGKVIPQVFDGITDYINLLIPDNMIKEDRIIGKLVKDIPTDNFNDVEVIGWLYQYYNQTEKDRVIGAKKAYKKTEIPYATQLFTPDWIVKYMVENSLGKYWLENHENKEIQESFKYYIEDAKQDEEVQKQLDKLKNPNLKPQEITFIDPCCGSGHILVYAFEVLYKIYESFGYNKQDIPKLILENNLHGLDIDDRAGQLSVLSVLLKARKYDKNLFKKDIILNIMSIQESNNINGSLLYDIKDKETNETIEYVLNIFKDAKEYGSLLKVNKMNYELVLNKISNIHSLQKKEIQQKIEPLFRQAILLSKEYDNVVTNPPYMSSSNMNNLLKDYLNKEYEDSKSDLFSAFIERCIDINKINKYSSLVTMQSWMFLSSYQKLREKLVNNYCICNLLHMDNMVMGIAFGTSATVFRKLDISKYRGFYNEVKNKNIINGKPIKFPISENKNYISNSETFSLMPGNQIAYWVSNNFVSNYDKGKLLSDVMSIKQGLATGNNEVYLRKWYEVEFNKIGIGYENILEFHNSSNLYAPYNKGGEFKKWYGNNEYVIKFNRINYGKLMNSGNHLPSKEFYFRKGITWSLISNRNTFGARISNNGNVFDVGGSSAFSNDKINYYLGFLCSNVAYKYLSVLNPTVNVQVGDIKNLPFNESILENCEIGQIVEKNIKNTKQDWDSFETSWDFKAHPLLEFKGRMPKLYDTNIISKPALANLSISKNNYGEDTYIIDNMPLNLRIEDSFTRWEEYCEKQFNQLKDNEEELNKIFIDIYGLQDELTPEVEDKDITIRKADRERDIKSLISYAVGCMFGRYSIYKEGLLFAGGKYDNEEIENILFENISNTIYGKIPKNEKFIVTDFYIPDLDNIIPINDNNYFMDDIIVKFKEFIKVAFGEKTLYENLDYIAETLGKRNTETSEDTIRRYFINDFYKEHVKTYQKRPIYWLLDSGKANGFKCLIYMHRYDENLLAKIRIDYLHKIQKTLENEYEKVEFDLTGELDSDKRRKLLNIQNDLSKKLTEIKDFDDELSHLALQKINIDLDDGVVVNYDKFKDILASIK